MWRGRTDIGYCVRSFIWNQVKYAILEKGSYIEKWSDLNEQNRVCKVDITPPVGIDFVGYHRETGINNIEERIYGTVLYLKR